MFKAPVLFLIFNRPDLTEQVFATIREAKPEKLFVAADGPRVNRLGEAELCDQTRRIVIENIDWECDVKLLLRNENLGCKVAVSSAISWFFEHVEEGIILEDDILPDNSFYKFCSYLLEKYRNDERITQISGVNLMTEMKSDADYFFSKVGGIWGWATWRRAWKHYDVNIASWNNKTVKDAIRKFLGNKKWFDSIKGNFDMVYNRQYDTWDYQWVYTQFYLGGMAITPKLNLVENIGFREDATHTKNSNEFIESLMKSNHVDFPLKDPIDVVPDIKYLSYYFSLINKPDSYFASLIKKIKSKLSNGFR